MGEEEWAKKNGLNDTTISLLKKEGINFKELVLLTLEDPKELENCWKLQRKN